MTINNSPKSRALFLELILDVVIFAICALVCLQVFASAKTSGSQSAAYSSLGIEAQSLAEDFSACKGDATLLARNFNADLEGNTITLYYDKDLNRVQKDDNVVFFLRCEVDASAPVKEAHISLTQGSKQLFSFTVCAYEPLDRSSAQAQAAGNDQGAVGGDER
jgi:hypothetical protein